MLGLTRCLVTGTILGYSVIGAVLKGPALILDSTKIGTCKERMWYLSENNSYENMEMF